MMNGASTLTASLPETYNGLSEIRPLRPIQDDEDFEKANWLSFRLEKLQNRTKDQEDYLNVLGVILKQYEEAQVPIDLSDVTQLDMLEHFMETRGMTASDLGRVIGHRTMGHKILKGERGLSKANILALAKFFHVSPGLFLELKPGTKPKKKTAAKRKATAAKPKKAVRKPAKKRTAAKS